MIGACRGSGRRGVGVNSVDVEDQAGPLAGGGTFDVAIDAGTELVASARLGLRVRLGEGFLFEPALRLDQHFADWDITDRNERCDCVDRRLSAKRGAPGVRVQVLNLVAAGRLAAARVRSASPVSQAPRQRRRRRARLARVLAGSGLLASEELPGTAAATLRGCARPRPGRRDRETQGLTVRARKAERRLAKAEA